MENTLAGKEIELMGILITPSTEASSLVEFRNPGNPKSLAFSLKDLQGCVQGYFELVPITKTDHWLYKLGYLTMAVNEDGRREELPFNAVASQLHGSAVVGNALLLKERELD